MMTDEELGRQRLAEREARLIALTDDADRLIKTLQEQSPDAWRSYVKTVDEEGIVEAAPAQTILNTFFALFPERDTKAVVDLLDRMLVLTRERLGKPPFKSGRQDER